MYGAGAWSSGQRQAAGTPKAATTKKAAPMKKAAPTKKTKPRPSQPERATSSKDGNSQPAPAPRKLCRNVKSAMYVFESDNESQPEETKAGPSRSAPARRSKAVPSEPAPAPAKPDSWRKIREAVSLFSSDEGPKPREKKDTGKAKQGMSNN